MTPASSEKHILVVDDENAILEVFRTLFSDDGYEMTFVDSGREALSILRSQHIDLVIADKNLPDLNGLEILRVAKEVNPLTEVIIITGYASLETVLQAMELDAYDYMLKPLHDIFEIKRKVRRAIEKQEMVLENQRLLKHLQEHAQALENALEERKRAEASLIQSEKLAGIGTLASGIAHEISSPLFGILGLAEAILDEDDRKLVREYAREIVDYSQQIREIVQDLSAYARTSRNEGVVPVELRRVIEDAHKLVQRSRKNDNVEMQIQVEDGLVMMARPNEVQQVLVNLMRNAAEALDNNPPDRKKEISVKAVRDGDVVLITIKDNGPGIPAPLVERIFEPFFTTKDVGKGTGLGLHIVYRIVSKYMGTISVESADGKGTTFRLRFPAQDS